MGAIQQVLLGYGAASATVYTTLNASDKAANVTLSGGNLIASTGAENSGIVRAMHGKSSGKFYFEAVITAASAETDTIGVGVANGSHGLTAALGYSTANGWALWGVTGAGFRNGSLIAAGPGYSQADVIGFHVDLDNDRIWVAINNTQIQGDPATNTSPLSTNLSGTIFPAACPWKSGRVITMRFDPASWSYSPASGYVGWTA